MKTLVSALLVLGFFSSLPSHGADPWKEQPTLARLKISAATTMGEYQLWSQDWKKNKRSAKSIDYSINVGVEATFFSIQMALEQNPHPQFLEECLLFLATKVPPAEFDHIWRARFLEMNNNLDRAVSKKVDEMLKAKSLPTLTERLLGDK